MPRETGAAGRPTTGRTDPALRRGADSRPPDPHLIGHYGSGKTEFAVNYALALAGLGRKTAICDLDIVNPYFRSRERKELMEASSIRVISNSIGANVGVDVPAVSAEVEAPIQDRSWDLVIDAGGDGAGARVLGRYSRYFTDGEYDMFCVLNANRPGTRTADDAVAHIRAIEEASRTRVTALVNNTHLLYETGPGHVLAGQRLCPGSLGAPRAADRLGERTGARCGGGAGPHRRPHFPADHVHAGRMDAVLNQGGTVMAKGRVVFEEDRCKGCGLCTTVCPVGIISLDTARINAKGYHPATVTDASKCTGCTNCAVMCPDIVISVYREKKPAAQAV